MRIILSYSHVTAAVLGAALVATSGCAGPSQSAATSGAGGGETRSAASTGYPVTVPGVCGQDVTVAAAPQRAIAMEQGASEVMLSLGLEERMAGTSYLTDPVLPELAAAYKGVPVLADEYPSPEVVRGAEPDFVYSMLSSAFTPEVAGTRAELADVGVASYVTRMNCEDPALSEDFTFDAFFQEVDDIASVFGVEERADEMIADQRTSLAQATEDAAAVTGEPTIMWLYSTYDGAPIVAGPGGVPDAVDDLVGARNVFEDLGPKWGEVSWEEIAQRDPDVIVLADLTRGRPGDSAEDKRELLTTNPVAAQLSAVTGDHLVELPGSALDPSVRSVRAVPALADALLDMGFGS